MAAVPELRKGVIGSAGWETHAHLTLYFVCVDGDDAELHSWVPITELALRPVELCYRRRVATYPAAEAHQAKLALPFLDMLFQVTESAL